MGFINKAERALDWFGRGQIIYQLLLGLGAGTILRAILKMYTHLNSLWITPIWLLASSGVVAVLVTFSKRLKKHFISQSGHTQLSSPSTAILQGIETFYKGQQGALLSEVQDSIRHELSAGNNEELLIRYLATALVMSFFEATWYVIFGSQIRALEFLNKGIAKMEDLIPFYTHDLDKRPQYTFEAWFGYLKEQVLIRQDGYNVNITVRGKAFLKYLVESGRTDNDKPF